MGETNRLHGVMPTERLSDYLIMPDHVHFQMICAYERDLAVNPPPEYRLLGESELMLTIRAFPELSAEELKAHASTTSVQQHPYNGGDMAKNRTTENQNLYNTRTLGKENNLMRRMTMMKIKKLLVLAAPMRRTSFRVWSKGCENNWLFKHKCGSIRAE